MTYAEAIIVAVLVCGIAVYLGWVYGLMDKVDLDVEAIVSTFIRGLFGGWR